MQKVPKFRGIFGRCGKCGIDFSGKEKNKWNFRPLFKRCYRQPLPTIQTIQQACERKKPNSAAFWNAYQMSLCNHLHQLEQDTPPDDKQQEKKLLRDGIRTVQAILYAIA